MVQSARKAFCQIQTLLVYVNRTILSGNVRKPVLAHLWDLIKHIYDFKEVIAHCITKWTVAQDELGCNHSSCYVESFTSDEACQHFMHWPPAAAYLSVGVGQTLTMVSRESSSVGAERG